MIDQRGHGHSDKFETYKTSDYEGMVNSQKEMNGNHWEYWDNIL